jgi:hypothetical protein
MFQFLLASSQRLLLRGVGIKASPLRPLEAAGSTNESTHPIIICELSPTPLSEVCVICEKSKLWLNEIVTSPDLIGLIAYLYH